MDFGQQIPLFSFLSLLKGIFDICLVPETLPLNYVAIKLHTYIRTKGLRSNYNGCNQI